MSVLNATSSHLTAVINEDHPDVFEMDDTLVANNEAEETLKPPGRGLLVGVARHTLGLILLLFVVFLWTISNFLGSVCVISPIGTGDVNRLTESDRAFLLMIVMRSLSS